MSNRDSLRRTLGRCAAAALLVLAFASVAESPSAPQHHERGSLVFDGIPPPDPALAARLERYEQSRQATFLDWLTDGSMLIRTVGQPGPEIGPPT